MLVAIRMADIGQHLISWLLVYGMENRENLGEELTPPKEAIIGNSLLQNLKSWQKKAESTFLKKPNGVPRYKRYLDEMKGQHLQDMWTDIPPVQAHEEKQSENVGRNVIDNFETAIRRLGKKQGAIVTFSFSKGANEEVAKAKNDDGSKIKLKTVEEILKET